LGFYDLRIPEIQRRQVELAKKYGIYGFCFHYYWFNGKRLLERPLDQFMSERDIDFPFCICWANENWTRRWDGLDHEVLMPQAHSEESDIAFIRDVAPILRHPRYIHINGRPLLIVYRAQLMPDPETTAERWKRYCREAGICEPFLVAARTFGFTDPREVDFDAALEFPPHNIWVGEINQSVEILNPHYEGRVYSYTELAEKMMAQAKQPYTLFKTVCPGWDNEPRMPSRGHSFAFSTPDAYKSWLNSACRYAMQEPDPEKRLVFINAWNEWAEGAYLEPDRRYGYAYLESTANALRTLTPASREKSQVQDTPNTAGLLSKAVKRHDIAAILHLYYFDLWEEISAYLINLDGEFDLYVSVPHDTPCSLVERIIEKYPHTYIYRCENRGRDIAPFLHIFSLIYPLGYKYLCKIHTKQSSHRTDGDAWRQDLLKKLLGSKELVYQARRILDTQTDVGIVGPEGHVLPSSLYLNSNVDNLKRLARLAGISYHQNFRFVASSMFWLSPTAFYPLTLLPIETRDFEPEQGQVDGTLAHAFERFFALLVKSKGLRVVELTPEGSQSPKDTTDYQFAQSTPISKLAGVRSLVKRCVNGIRRRPPVG
jgi:lipopolysaccharide biosynthesis protein